MLRNPRSLGGIYVGLDEDGRFHLIELPKRKPCSGFANCCTCGCRPKSEQPAVAQPAPRQPWELAA